MGNQIVTQQQKDFGEFFCLLKEQAASTNDFEILSPRRRRTYFTSYISGWEFSDSTEFSVEDKGINLGEFFTFSSNAVYVIFHSFIKRKKRLNNKREDEKEEKEVIIPKLIENLKDSLTPRSQTHSFSGFHSSYSQVQHQTGKSINKPKLNYDIYVWYGKKVSQITKAVSMSKVLELEKLIDNPRVQEFLLSLFFDKTFYSTKVSPLFTGQILDEYYDKTFTKELSFNELFSFLNKRAIPKQPKSPHQFHSTSETQLNNPSTPKKPHTPSSAKRSLPPTPHSPSIPIPSPNGKDSFIKQYYQMDKDFTAFKIPKKPNRICNKHSILENIKTSNSVVHNHMIEIQVTPPSRRSKSTVHKVSSPRGQYNIQIKSKIQNDKKKKKKKSSKEIKAELNTNLSINIDINNNSPLDLPSKKPQIIPKLQLNINNINCNNNNNNNNNNDPPTSISPSSPSSASLSSPRNNNNKGKGSKNGINTKKPAELPPKVSLPKIDIPSLQFNHIHQAVDVKEENKKGDGLKRAQRMQSRSCTHSHPFPLSPRSKDKKKKRNRKSRHEKRENSSDKHHNNISLDNNNNNNKLADKRHSAIVDNKQNFDHSHKKYDKAEKQKQEKKDKRNSVLVPPPNNNHNNHNNNINNYNHHNSSKHKRDKSGGSKHRDGKRSTVSHSFLPPLSLPPLSFNNNNNNNNNKNMSFSINLNLLNGEENGPPSPGYLPFNLPERIRYYDPICSQITDHVYLGSNTVAKDLEKLQSHGITHILNCASSICNDYFPSNFHYKSLPLLDSPNEDISSLFYEVLDYIDCVVKNNAKVFVHCYQGVSRSASMVILYLMWKNKTKFQETHEIVKKLRDIANPNPGFITQLMRYSNRKRVNPPSPLLFRIVSHNTSPDLIALSLLEPLPSADKLDDRFCYLLQTSQNNLYIWKGKNSEAIYLEYSFTYAQRLQKFEGFDAELFIEESGNETEEFKSLFPSSPNV